MAGRIHLFRSAQKYQRMMGIYSTELNECAPFSCRNLFFLMSFAHFCIPSFAFFVFEANSFKDYANSFYSFITSLAACTFYTVQMLQITNFDLLTKKFEEFIERSE